MTEEKKFKEFFPDFEYRFFSIVLTEKEIEGIQGPVYRPSGEILQLDKSDTVEIKEQGEVFHDGKAKVYELSGDEMDVGEKKEKIVGYIPCPACATAIPITTNERPIKITCPHCGKKGKLE